MEQKRTLQSKLVPHHAHTPKQKRVFCHARGSTCSAVLAGAQQGLGAPAITGARPPAASMPQIVVLHMGEGRRDQHYLSL